MAHFWTIPGNARDDVYLALRMFGETHGMVRSRLATLLLLVRLLPNPAAAAETTSRCVDAAVEAERAWKLPPNLIHAIGRVESGRLDQATGRRSPWPWTVNANGSGYFFASMPDAVAFVRNLQSRGVRLIDVGCFQVDLFYHSTAFSSLEQAFDPGANADYAARFLSVLHARTGSWAAAIAGYHSDHAQEGESYRQKVMSQWGLSEAPTGTITTPTAGHTASHQPAQDQFVVLMSAAARAIHVFRP